MKKHTGMWNVPVKIFPLIIFLVLFSCQKVEDIQTFNDVFDTSGIDELNLILGSTETLDDISAVFGNISFEVPTLLNNISLDDMIEHYENNLELSPDEIDMLLKNDSKTYVDVIDRMGSLPGNLSNMFYADESLKSGSTNVSKELHSSTLNKYLLKQKIPTSNFYADDYYSAVLAYQNYIACAVIKPLKSVKKLKSNQDKKDKDKEHNGTGNDDSGNNGHGNDPSPDATLNRTVLIVSNNNWDMWWAYWSDGRKTKHKGAAGSYPGN